MEYEFFPGSRSTSNNEDGMMNLGVNSEASSYADGERETGFDASTSLDLSLKLSYQQFVFSHLCESYVIKKLNTAF